MEIKIISIIFLILCAIFLITRKEILYLAIVTTLLLVSFPLIVSFDRVTTKYPSTSLLLDYSPSSIEKTKIAEKTLPLQEFDYIRKFGIPYNKKDELKNISNPDEITLVVSDFLFELPEEITKNSNIFLVYLEETTRTNHTIRSISLTNIAQSEFLLVETLFPSEIKIIDPKTKKLIFKDNNSSNYLIPTLSLPENISIHSLNTNITIPIPRTPQIGILWYEVNQDLRILLSTLRELGYSYDLIPKIKEKINIPNKKYKNLILGYPDETLTIEKILDITEEKSRIIIVTPSEGFLRNMISFSHIKNFNLKPEDFIYEDSIKLFNLNFSYPVKIKEAFRYHSPKISGKIIPLDKYNTTFYLSFSDREMIVILIKELFNVDVENLKLGIYSSFSQEIFIELTKFFQAPENTKIINLQESAISGGIKPKGNAIYFKEISREFIKGLKKKHSSTIIEQQKINLSSLWPIMVVIIISLGIKWLIKK